MSKHKLPSLDNIDKKSVHSAVIFAVGITGVIGFFELIVAISIQFINLQSLETWLIHTAVTELVESPHSLIWQYVVQTVPPPEVLASIKGNSELWLIIHGLTNVLLAYAVFRQKLFMYPIAIVSFTILTGYQVFMYFKTPSIILAFLIVVSLVVIVLTLFEYKRRRKQFHF